MTRKEEIEKASIEYQMSVSPVVIGGAAFADEVEIFNINSSFVAGAEWADRTMLEKAVKWLISNANDYIINDKQDDGRDWLKIKSEMFEDFKKAMMEE